MCGIIAVLLSDPQAHVNQLIYDGLTVLQHRGQDAAGIMTSHRGRLHLRKDNGLVRDVFQQRHMLNLRGSLGIGHTRYPTAGSSSCAEAQPFYTNSPYGLALAHNGNLTNKQDLVEQLFRRNCRHVNTDSDSELLLNVLADELLTQTRQHTVEMASHTDTPLTSDNIFDAVTGLFKRCRGGFSAVVLINGHGIVAFRDPHGIRPLCLGTRGSDYAISSESVALDALGFELLRDVAPGEAIFITSDTSALSARRCDTSAAIMSPCIFEYVYFARPDSTMDGISIYQARLNMGTKLAEKIIQTRPDHMTIDVVIPIPDTSRTSALQVARTLNLPYREGFVKNRYIARTFIMPGQAVREATVRLKLNAIRSEFKDKAVLLIDDSIVRGTTSQQIVQFARAAGARAVYFASAAPAIRYPNVYGIDMPTKTELIANGKTTAEIATAIGADWLVYQDLTDLVTAVQMENPSLTTFDTSCFSGTYVTGDITPAYFTALATERSEAGKAAALQLPRTFSNASFASEEGIEMHNE